MGSQCLGCCWPRGTIKEDIQNKAVSDPHGDSIAELVTWDAGCMTISICWPRETLPVTWRLRGGKSWGVRWECLEEEEGIAQAVLQGRKYEWEAAWAHYSVRHSNDQERERHIEAGLEEPGSHSFPFVSESAGVIGGRSQKSCPGTENDTINPKTSVDYQ